MHTVKFIEGIVKSSYWFLVEQYDFAYIDREYITSEYDFISPIMKIRIEVGRKSPNIVITKIGEPEDIILLLNAVMEYFKYEYPGIQYSKNSLEDNILRSAKRFEKYAPNIIRTIDDWWIPTLLFHYKKTESLYRNNNQYEGFIKTFKRKRDYLISKGVL